MKCSEGFSLLSLAGITTLAMLMVGPGASAQGTPNPTPTQFSAPGGLSDSASRPAMHFARPETQPAMHHCE